MLFPALGVGYLVIPDDQLDRFPAVREAMDVFPPATAQAALTDFVADGHFARHVRRTRGLYRERRRALVDGLRSLGPRWRVVGAEAGIHLVALADCADDRAIAERAVGDGLWAMPLSACYLRRPSRSGLVLGYGGTPVEPMPRAVERLGRAIAAS